MTTSLRTTGKWLSRLTGLTILFLSVAVTSGEQIHGRVLEIGEEHWDEYFLLRAAGSIQAPDCERNPDITARVHEKKKELESDPLAKTFDIAVDEDAARQSVIQAREICRDKWQRYDKIQKRLSPGLTTFSAMEKSLAGAVTFIGPHKRSWLALLILFCAAASTFQRRNISVLPVETQRDHRVHSVSMIVTNSFLFGAAVTHHLEWQKMDRAADDPSLGLLWMAAFALLALASFYRLLSPPRDLVPGGSRGMALLCVPLFSLLCLLGSFMVLSQGVVLAAGMFLSMAQEGSLSLLLRFLIVVWIAIWLVNRVETSTPQERSCADAP